VPRPASARERCAAVAIERLMGCSIAIYSCRRLNYPLYLTRHASVRDRARLRIGQEEIGRDKEMPAYRGIEKNEILKSIQQGVDLLQDLHIGSATDKRCSEWMNASPLARIEEPTTDEALVAAMRSTGARVFFRPFYEAIRFHAIFDSASAGNKNSALDVYTMLNAWGAFALVRYRVSAEVEAEVADYVLEKYLGRYVESPEEERRLENLCKELSDKNLGKWIEDSIRLWVGLKKIDEMETVYELRRERELRNGRPGDGQIVTMVLESMADLDKREDELGIPTALSRYSVTVGPLQDAQDMAACVGPMLRELKELNLLASFAASDEACDIMYAGPIGAGRDLGLTLYCSKRAAQACADAMPARKIVDRKGQQIHAAELSPSPAQAAQQVDSV
jgi:hypothetical protein